MNRYTLLTRALVLLTVALSFTGCDKLDEADDISFDVEFTGTFEIEEQGDFENKLYSSSMEVDAKSNSKVADYAAKIKSIKINKITYRIANYAAPGAVLFSNGELAFGPAGGAAEVVATVGTLNLQTVGANETELDLDETELNIIAADLLDKLKVAIYTEGTLSDTPVAFDVPVKFYCTITANAL
jgi:hypothetical protein